MDNKHIIVVILLIIIGSTATILRVFSKIDCKVTDWSEFSGCSKSCVEGGGGTQTRTRKIITPQSGGAQCPALSETKPCPQCPVNCIVGEWGDFSECAGSKPCAGTQTRTRVINTPPSAGGDVCPPLTETKSCITAQCKPRPTTVKDCGYSDMTRGWYDYQNQGAKNDYCRYIGDKPNEWFSCLKAGTILNTTRNTVIDPEQDYDPLSPINRPTCTTGTLEFE